jgi:hypothetical protein
MFLLIVPAMMLAAILTGNLMDFLMFEPVAQAATSSLVLDTLTGVQQTAELRCAPTPGCPDGAVNFNQTTQPGVKGTFGTVSYKGNVISWFTYPSAAQNATLLASNVKISDATASTLGQYNAAAQLAVGRALPMHGGLLAPAMAIVLPASLGIPDQAIIIAEHR